MCHVLHTQQARPTHITRQNTHASQIASACHAPCEDGLHLLEVAQEQASKAPNKRYRQRITLETQHSSSSDAALLLQAAASSPVVVQRKGDSVCCSRCPATANGCPACFKLYTTGCISCSRHMGGLQMLVLLDDGGPQLLCRNASMQQLPGATTVWQHAGMASNCYCKLHLDDTAVSSHYHGDRDRRAV